MDTLELKEHQTGVVHEGDPTRITVYYTMQAGQIEIRHVEDHLRNFVSLDLLQQKEVRDEIRDEHKEAV